MDLQKEDDGSAADRVLVVATGAPRSAGGGDLPVRRCGDVQPRHRAAAVVALRVRANSSADAFGDILSVAYDRP
jgi:hypothetical protein